MNHKRHKPRRQPCHKISSWDRVTGNAAGRQKHTEPATLTTQEISRIYADMDDDWSAMLGRPLADPPPRG